MNGAFRTLCVKRAFSYRSLSLCVSNNKSWNPVMDSRNFEVGKSMFELLAVNSLVENYPSLSAAHINDITQGLSSSPNVNIQIPNTDRINENLSDLFIELGTLQLKAKLEKVSHLLNILEKQCFSNISTEEINELIISQHPKALLQMVNKDNDLFLTSYKIDFETSEANIYVDGELLFTEQNSSLVEAERIVCLNLLNKKFSESLKTIQVGEIDFPLEEEIQFGTSSHKQRTVEMLKLGDEQFGFTIRGGEQKVIRNKEFIQLNIITPVFISYVEKNSPAEKCGLSRGDVLLAVNDHSLKNVTHKQAVTSLKKFKDSIEVSFVVSFEKEEVLKFEAEKDLVEREKKKLKEELSCDKMSKWHHAKAKLNPEEYLVGEIKHKKRPFQAKQARKSVRLWDLKN